MQNFDPNAPLRDNVKFLGEILGQVLKDQVGESLYQIVEEIRILSKGASLGDEIKAKKLAGILKNLSPNHILGVVRAFSHFLNLANIAESHHRIRRNRWHKTHRAQMPQKGSLKWIFKKLQDEGISAKKLQESIAACKLELVLTAHPTEVVRRTLIQKFDRVRECLSQLDRVDLTPDEKSLHYVTLYREITAIWLTDEIRRKRPTPIEEAKWGFAVIENSLWYAIPQYLRELDQLCHNYTGLSLPIDAIPMRFGSWMGGDRDGNPNVTHLVTQQVCFLARWSAANLYEKAIRDLIAELSMKDCDENVRKKVGEHPEPYRALLKPIRELLKQDLLTLEHCCSGQATNHVLQIIRIDQLLDPLLLCYHSLKNIGASIIAEGALLDLIRRIYCFGLTLARLDIRQESNRHQTLMNEILAQNSLLKSANEEDYVKFLLHLCENPTQITVNTQLLSVDSLEVWQSILLIKQQPADTFGAYVISMTKKPSDIVTVYALQKLAGILIPIRVVPLFETLADLQSAAQCLEMLFRFDSYRNLVRSKQEVMIGYSDSAKDAGIIAANWAIYLAQEQCLEMATKYQIQLTLFHGRGGTVGRGGSPAYMAILSQPRGAMHGSMRITEQGEVIRTKFGFTKNAIRTLELYTSAILEAHCNKPPVVQKNWRALMDRIAHSACTFYQKTIYEDPKFAQYFFAVTPINEIGQLFISSRPVKRGSKAGIEALRAIPWIFAWTQNRMMTPSWLGVGEALKSLNSEHRVLLDEMVEKWPFFKSLISLIEMVVAKTDPSIALHYEQCLASGQVKIIGEKIRNDFNHTHQIVKELLKIHDLLENNNMLDRSLKVRQSYVYPLNILQAELLARERRGEASSSEHREALLISISGIAAGMRNTG